MPDIRSSQSFDYFIELYDDVDIIISTTSNQNGILYLDANSNVLGSIISSGANYITTGVKALAGNILIHDDTGNFVYIDDDFGEDDIDKHFLIKPGHSLLYKINAERVTNATVSGNKLVTNLTSKEIFKVFLNGRIMESTEYTSDNTGITISSPYNSIISGISNDIIIYTYPSIQTITGATLTLTYSSPHTLVPDLADLLDSSYVGTYADSVCTFDGLDAAISKNNNSINHIYQYVSKDKQVNRDSKLNITMYDDLTQEDFRNILKNQARFRLIMWDKVETRMTMYVNCIWKTGASSNINKTKIDRTFNIDFDDELTLIYSGGASVYGEGFYGFGTYGNSNLDITVYGT